MNRRDFLKDTAAGSFMAALAMGAVELRADTAPVDEDEKPKGPAVGCAVIGVNDQGKQILSTLAKLGAGWANVSVICDTYTKQGFVDKAKEIAPKAAFVPDYRAALDNKSVQAVFVATPSHQHKQIVLDALAAGKHVYCEAPLATDLSDARDIAVAGQAAMAKKMWLMPGLQVRSNKQHIHVNGFVKSGAMGKVVAGRAEWHSHNDKTWYKAAPKNDRAVELSWRLMKATSSGLLGEVAIHQIDIATWFLKSLPIAVTGFRGPVAPPPGSDDNGAPPYTPDIPGTVQCVLEYPHGVNFIYDATLASSYEGAYELFMGTESTIQTRDQRAWMFKEPDAPALGWEGFARKDSLVIGADANAFKIGEGIALVADASKQLALGLDPAKAKLDLSKTALYAALRVFLTAVQTGNPPAEPAGGPKAVPIPAPGPVEGFNATVLANKANEAALTQSRIEFKPEWFLKA